MPHLGSCSLSRRAAGAPAIFEGLGALYQPFPMLPGKRAQLWRHQPSYLRPRHFHAEPEINWITRGRARMGVGSRTVEVRAGDVLFLPAGVDHVLLDATTDLELFVSALAPELAARVVVLPATLAAGGTRLDERRLYGLEEELVALGEVRDPGIHEARVAGLFFEMWRLAAPVPALSRRALTAISSDPTLSEAALARRFRTGPSRVSRQVRHDLGVKLVDYRTRLRLMRFIELVDAGRTYVTAALDAGFGSYAQCHRMFRRIVACSPSDYFGGARFAIDTLTAGGLDGRGAKVAD